MQPNPSTDKFQSIPASSRLLIAISGIPGSGKTSIATRLVNGINQHYAQAHSNATGNVAAAVSLDGYHLTRAQLAAMADSAHAFARRGAAFTFDAVKFAALVRVLREPVGEGEGKRAATIYAPSFDHAVKDPVEDDVPIPPEVRVVIFEGNYLNLDKEPWNKACEMMDELWFVDVDFDTARKRLVKRHLQAGIAQTEEEADKRAVENDLVNGEEIVNNRLPVSEIIQSKADPSWLS